MADATIKEFSMEQGFGTIDHPEHGELFFDYEACNFPPEPGDQVIVEEVKERRFPKGTLKAVRVTCPTKPPKS